MLAMIATLQEINSIKLGPFGLPNFMSESVVNDPSLNRSGSLAAESPQLSGPADKVTTGNNNEDADFGLTFTVPRICLNLKTR